MSDFSVYLAEEIVDWMSQGTQLDTPPTDVYVTVFDDTDTELDGNLSDARTAVSTSGDWTKNGTNFENAVEIDLGEAGSDLSNITDVALYDAETGGNELARYEQDQAPYDVSAGTNIVFDVGDLSFDVVDRTE